MAKKLDYYTRACRLEELPLLQAAVEPEAQKAREEHERSMREIEEHSRAEHERQLAEKNRLIRMKADVQVSFFVYYPGVIVHGFSLLFMVLLMFVTFDCHFHWAP